MASFALLVQRLPGTRRHLSGCAAAPLVLATFLTAPAALASVDACADTLHECVIVGDPASSLGCAYASAEIREPIAHVSKDIGCAENPDAPAVVPWTFVGVGWFGGHVGVRSYCLSPTSQSCYIGQQASGLTQETGVLVASVTEEAGVLVSTAGKAMVGIDVNETLYWGNLMDSDTMTAKGSVFVGNATPQANANAAWSTAYAGTLLADANAHNIGALYRDILGMPSPPDITGPGDVTNLDTVDIEEGPPQPGCFGHVSNNGGAGTLIVCLPILTQLTGGLV